MRSSDRKRPPSPGLRSQPFRRRPHGGDHLGRRRIELLPGVGERKRTVPSLEERHAELVLELLHLPAHRRLSEEKLLGGLGEGQMARRRLEAAQQVEGRHCITFTHAWPENLPFEPGAARMHPAHAKCKECTMKIELDSGLLRLERGQTLRVVDGAGSTICAHTGSLWITEENRPADVVLSP